MSMSNAFENNQPDDKHRELMAGLIGTAVVPDEMLAKVGYIPRTFRVIQGGELPKVHETLEDIWGPVLEASTTNRPEDEQTIGHRSLQ